MDKIKNFINKFPIVDFIVLAVIISVFSFIFANHQLLFIADKGREFLFPQEILNGKVPYKDIMLIYFPTAYYINAFIYKILGVSMNSLFISQGFLSIVYIYVYYLLAKMFLERKTSFLLSVLVIVSCIFSYNDLFAFITPYSYARAYGVVIYMVCALLALKLFRAENTAYLYWIALFSGLCFICKFEFFIAYILLAAVLFFYKRLTLYQYIKIGLMSLVFPVILLVFLYSQGVSTADIIAAAEFGFKFSKTPVMTEFLSNCGLYPFKYIEILQSIAHNIPNLITVLLLCFTALKLNLKYAKPWIIPFMTIIIWLFFYNKHSTMQYWVFLPYAILLFFGIKYKELLSENKELLLLTISTLLIAQRCFFYTSLYSYGIYSAPLLFLTALVIIKAFLPPSFLGVNLKSLVVYAVFILTGLYSISLVLKYDDTQMPIITDKGTIYTDVYNFEMFDGVISYVKNKIDKNASVLVLPEGHIINFLTDRKTNLKCHMMDRLYHDAYGEEKAKDMIASANADYIILIDGVKLNEFYGPYLYGKDVTLSGQYINEYYTQKRVFYNKLGFIRILKKNK